MAQPSLLDSTTTGRPTSDGRKTRSQLTYMLLTSTSANTAFASDGHRLDRVGHDAPDLQFLAIAGNEVCARRIGRLEPDVLALPEEAPADELVVDHGDH